MTSRSAETILEVVVDDVVFQREDGRFTVARATREPSGEAVTLVGDLGHISPGEVLRVRGKHAAHATYGAQFVVQSFTPVLPTSREGVTRYLGSGLVPGLGPALAERLVKRFGDRTLDVIATESAKLREVPGIGKKRAETIAEAVRSRRAEADSLSFLHGLGLGRALAKRVLERYGDAAGRVLRDDPYVAAEEIAGIGWETSDRLGRAAGIAKDDVRRAAGALLHLVGRAVDDGNVYVATGPLLSSTSTLEVPEARAKEALEGLVERGVLIREGDAIYPPPLHRAEIAVAEKLATLARPRGVPSGIERVIAALPSNLASAQRDAVRATLEHGLVVLTGGPGTGKTTTVRAIVEAHVALGHRVLLCAPTGRAAKRLAEATGALARTIHRTLEWNPARGDFKRGEDEPLDAELILVDEASMLDLRLADKLIGAVPPASRLVMVGDIDQLPPVGPGRVLREVIASEVCKTVRLHEVFRQAQESAIVRGAHALLRGELPTPTPANERGPGDLFFVRPKSDDAIPQVLRILERLAQAYGLDPKRDVQVLSPMKKGPIGTDRLNLALQAFLNPSPTAKPKEGEPARPRPGDKVMQLRNDYDKDVFNGDLGEVRRVDGGSTFVDVDGREIQYTMEDIDDLQVAYASTVHKVQGSEFPAVVVALHASQYPLLSRAMLYTAITRAKRVVVMVGDPAPFQRAARNANDGRTSSRLAIRLRETVARRRNARSDA